MRSLALATTLLLMLSCGGEPPPVATSPPGRPARLAPPPADPPAVVEGAITQATVDGLEVLVKRIPGAELAAIQLYVRGGARNWTAATAGVETLALVTAASGGTDKTPKDEFARKLASLGSDLDASTGNEFSFLAAKTLTPHFDETFDLLADAFLAPTLPPSEVELQRQKMLSRLRHEEESPDSRLALLVHRAVFKGHPFENRAVGTIDSVSKLTADQLKADLAELRQKSRLLLVVVGDIDAAHVASLVKARFGAVPRGSWRESPLPPIRFGKSAVDVVTAPLPTTYVQGTFTVPGWHDPDFFASMVAMQHLGFRMFEEVRTKRNLSYAPSASLRWASAVPLGTLYVTAVDPDATIKVMFDEVKKLKTNPLTPKELAAAKATFLTDHLASSEATDSQAIWLARAQIHHGDWRLETQLLDRVRRVTEGDVQAFASKYIQHLQFAILGKGTVDKGLFGSL